jgi:hypothetical protein
MRKLRSASSGGDMAKTSLPTYKKVIISETADVKEIQLSLAAPRCAVQRHKHSESRFIVLEMPHGAGFPRTR